MNTRISISGRARRQAGQAMVEYALVSLFLFVLFVSILQIILLVYAYATLANAAKEGVRYAVVHGTGFGAAGCSGPGVAGSKTSICSNDATGSFVQTQVLGFAQPSFQSVTSGEVTVDYDPSSANTTSFGGPCSTPGCVVRVTVSHSYSPIFGLSWASFTMNAAAEGTIVD